MVSTFVVAFLIREASSSRVAEHSGHVDIQLDSNKVGATQVTCRQAWTAERPEACLPGINETSQLYLEFPLESCPESCQTYFTAVVDSCSVGDEHNEYGDIFAQYTAWEAFHHDYPACNVGPSPPACQRAWNGRRLPNDCPVAELNYTSPVLSPIPLESCPEPCQTYFTGVLDSCSVGDDFDSSLSARGMTYEQHRLWGEFFGRYPECNLGYTASACDTAMSAVLDTIFGICQKSANSPCTAECSALFENVKTNCSDSATWVPTAAAGSRTLSEQTWSLSTVTRDQFGFVFDETCVALLSAGGSAGGSEGASAGASATTTTPSDSRRAYIGWWMVVVIASLQAMVME